MKNLLLFSILFVLACTPKPKTIIPAWVAYDESEELDANVDHKIGRMQYKLIQSKISDKNSIWKDVADQIAYFSEDDYQKLKPLILDQDIPVIQSNIKEGKLSYESLTQWYLYRIAKFENDSSATLHTIISVNSKAVQIAKERDENQSGNDHPLYGMPILLKDNINTSGMPTTAGAHALLGNQTTDAFIVERIKEKGGIILGKVNLSEWAYYFCSGCPVGYSSVGGQTLNPYGRRQFETGGSSSGSGASMAASYAAAAVGTETSGSILSPSSKNSIVGLKPTIGLLSRGGIVPISSTLDTPGPMTRSVIDNAILLSAMSGEDREDPATKDNPKNKTYFEQLESVDLKGLRFGVNKGFLEDSVYRTAMEKIVAQGADTIEFRFPDINFNGFRTFLNADMKVDLPKYLETHTSENIRVTSVADVVAHNLLDTAVRMPYGQQLFEGIVTEDISAEDFEELKKRFSADAINYFESIMTPHKLDAILSINNRNASHAAMAKYPCLTVPMGYKNTGEPVNLTFIARPFEEDKLLKMGYAFEQKNNVRKSPQGYD
jgi:amidase